MQTQGTRAAARGSCSPGTLSSPLPSSCPLPTGVAIVSSCSSEASSVLLSTGRSQHPCPPSPPSAPCCHVAPWLCPPGGPVLAVLGPLLPGIVHPIGLPGSPAWVHRLWYCPGHWWLLNVLCHTLSPPSVQDSSSSFEAGCSFSVSLYQRDL